MIDRTRVRVSSSALTQNYRVLRKKSDGLKLLPMIKADAYGHGMQFVAETLVSEKDLQGFGVATFNEAVLLRKTLKAKKVSILVFSDCAPWTSERFDLCKRYDLEPVLSELKSVLQFQSSKRHHEVKAHLEINTGMNRLGIPAESLPIVQFYPASVFTHLADAENPKSKITRLQMMRFEEVVSYVRRKFPQSALHFANSAAIWNAKSYSLFSDMDWVRPGLSLYGIRPFETARQEGLKPVMTISAPILNRIFLDRGDSVGYGATYQCTKKAGEWVAILGAGYADGIFRTSSNQGIAYHAGKALSFRGRVSMDLLAIEGHANLTVGDDVELWGADVDPYDQATRSGTNPYEWVTRVGSRVKRIYE